MSCCSSTFFGIIGIALVGIAVKIYLKLRLRKNGCYTCLAGKTAIVTGANIGIGYFTALDFAMRGARVILACRNKDKAEDAQRKIIRASQNSNVVYKIVDFSSIESVRSFARDINETEERLDILVNNAGGIFLGNHYTNDGLQIVLHTNHISPFLLTHLLIDKIKQSAPSRIVNISSNSASHAKLNVDTINEFPNRAMNMLSDYAMYANTKLCNILFTIILANKLRGTGVTVNAVHPGGVKTDVFKTFSGIGKALIDIQTSLFFRTSEEGAQTNIYVSTSEALNDVTGKLFDNCKEIDLYETAKDPILAKRVWEKSEELAKLEESEKIK